MGSELQPNTNLHYVVTDDTIDDFVFLKPVTAESNNEKEILLVSSDPNDGIVFKKDAIKNKKQILTQFIFFWTFLFVSFAIASLVIVVGIPFLLNLHVVPYQIVLSSSAVLSFILALREVSSDENDLQKKITLGKDSSTTPVKSTTPDYMRSAFENCDNRTELTTAIREKLSLGQDADTNDEWMRVVSKILTVRKDYPMAYMPMLNNDVKKMYAIVLTEKQRLDAEEVEESKILAEVHERSMSKQSTSEQLVEHSRISREGALIALGIDTERLEAFDKERKALAELETRQKFEAEKRLQVEILENAKADARANGCNRFDMTEDNWGCTCKQCSPF